MFVDIPSGEANTAAIDGAGVSGSRFAPRQNRVPWIQTENVSAPSGTTTGLGGIRRTHGAPFPSARYTSLPVQSPKSGHSRERANSAFAPTHSTRHRASPSKSSNASRASFARPASTNSYGLSAAAAIISRHAPAIIEIPRYFTAHCPS